MNKPLIKKLLEKIEPQILLKEITPYIPIKRHQKIKTVLEGRIAQIGIAMEAPSNIHNAAAVIRTAEAFGTFQVHLIAPRDTAVQSPGITQGAFKWVDIQFHDEISALVSLAKKKGIRLVGTSLDATYKLSDLDITTPLCLLLGNETEGLSSEALSHCDETCMIPMFGMSQSLNLSVSASIGVYDLTQRYRQHIGQLGDLSEEEKIYWEAFYTLLSVNPKLLDELSKR